MANAALQTGNWWSADAAASLAPVRAVLLRWGAGQADQLFCWLPVALGAGIAAWFALPGPRVWGAVIVGGCGIALLGAALGAGTRLHARALLLAGLAIAGGCALMWARSAMVAHPVLDRAVVVSVTGRIDSVEWLAARGAVRMVVRLDGGQRLPGLARLSVPTGHVPASATLSRGRRIAARVRLMPPPAPALPGGYDFQRRAWFDGLGAVGSVLGTLSLPDGAGDGEGLAERLTRHVHARVPGSAGGIAAAFVTGDRGGISAADEDALRRAGLAHLLSISGLHVTAAVAGVMALALRLLSLSPWLAVRAPLHLIAGAIGAGFGIGYTLLTGAEVPTVRSLIAALLVLLALALGRQALSMRLVAVGALAVMLLRPEAVAGPSFQLSFAAIATIVALHGNPRIAALLARREEGMAARLVRSLTGLVMTGVAVEMALMPIALFHFHQSGVYGTVANLVAIPLTTVVVMPAEALALLLDSVGLGGPLWWVVGQALGAMIVMAHAVAGLPGSVLLLPDMPRMAFALCIAGTLWLCLIAGRTRWWGAAPWLMGMVWTAALPPPDLLVTGDGRHVAVRDDAGRLRLLRERAGDYVRDEIAEAMGDEAAALPIAAIDGARCSPDFCGWSMQRGGRRWHILASRSGDRVDWRSLVDACARADIVLSDRWLPRGCKPRWLKLDAAVLRRTGGLAIRLDPASVRSVAAERQGKPWVDPPTIAPPRVSTLRGASAGKGSGRSAAAPPVADQ